MLIYQHERNLHLDSIVDGLYFGSTFFDWVGLGVGLDWVRGPYAGADAHRLPEDVVHLLGRWAVAQRRDQLQRLHPEPRQCVRSEHLGHRVRQPARAAGSRWASSLKDIGDEARTRTWELAFGVRPWGDWLTLGANWQFPGFGTLDQSRVGAVVRARAGPGRGARDLGDQELARAQRPVVLAGVAHRRHRAPGPRLRAGRRARRDRQRRSRPGCRRPRYREPRAASAATSGRSTSTLRCPAAARRSGCFGLRDEDPYLRLLRRLSVARQDRNARRGGGEDRAPAQVGLAQAEELRGRAGAAAEARASASRRCCSPAGTRSTSSPPERTASRVSPQSFLAINGLDGERHLPRRHDAASWASSGTSPGSAPTRTRPTRSPGRA